MEYLFLTIIPFIIGIMVGTQMSLWLQMGLVVGIVLYLNSKSVAAMEIGALFVMIPLIIFIVGMVAGDISWVIQTNAFNEWNISNPFVVNK